MARFTIVPALIFGILLIAGVIAGSAVNLPFGGKLIPPTGPDVYGGAACLDDSAIDRTNVVLPNFPKATEVNVPFPNNGPCSGGGCEGPDFADYVLAASDVKVEKIWPHPPTTRLYKQILPAGSQHDSIRDRVYRASCNDWCLLGLPYGGTFHCDFVWLYKEDRFIDKGGELYPDDTGCDLKNAPENCPTFDVLIRSDAPIPDKVKCSTITPTPVSQQHPENSFALIIRKAQAIGRKAFAQPMESFIDFAGSRWIYSEELVLIKENMRTEAEGREYLGNAIFRSQEYEVYKNLTRKINPTNEFIYLVIPGKVEEANNQLDPFFKFYYLEFRKSPEVRPQAKSLQLGTFKVPTGKGWWRKWIDESKPAIYLYPEKPTQFTVKLNPKGKLIRVDPPYDPQTGWQVVAYPNGTIHLGGVTASTSLQPATPEVEPTTYNYLFYEANLEEVYVEPSGFVVKGSELVEFFKNELPKWGLLSQEIEDFIEYWMGRLDKNQPYYFIHFLSEDQIEALEPLTIEQCDNETIEECYKKTPDVAIRIRTYFKPLNSPVEMGDVSAQTPLPVPSRHGFTLVEWGGILDE